MILRCIVDGSFIVDIAKLSGDEIRLLQSETILLRCPLCFRKVDFADELPLFDLQVV